VPISNRCVKLRIRLDDLEAVLRGGQLQVSLPEDAEIVAVEQPMLGFLQGWFYAYITSESFKPVLEQAGYPLLITS
jgi:hypothetical protein